MKPTTKTNDMLAKGKLASNWSGLAYKIEEALKLTNQDRLRMAQELVDVEYQHPECRAVAAKPEQRSFCFQHGQITKKTVLLLHGFTACPYEMRELGEVLYQRGFNVYGVRLAGHGTSVKDFAQYNREDWLASAVKGFMIAALMGEELYLVGESMGGAIAAILGQNFSFLTCGLILCAPCFRIANPLAWLTRYKIMQRLIPENDMGVQFEWQYDYWYRVIPTSRVAELVRLASLARKVGPKLSTPTLIIQAANDCIVNPKGATSFYNTLKQLEPNAKELVLFEGGHHNLTIGLNPNKDKVFKWVSNFIDSTNIGIK